jgi:hypothetical protein
VSSWKGVGVHAVVAWDIGHICLLIELEYFIPWYLSNVSVLVYTFGYTLYIKIVKKNFTLGRLYVRICLQALNSLPLVSEDCTLPLGHSGTCWVGCNLQSLSNGALKIDTFTSLMHEH